MTINNLRLAVLKLSKLIQQASLQKRDLVPQDLLNRLGRLPAYQSLSLDQRYARLPEIKLSDCKMLIALEHGESSFEALMAQDDWLVYDEKLNNGGLNLWFANYLEAKAYQQEKKKTFLFPYKNTFFVCKKTHLEVLGVDPNDPDWEKINRDWVQPIDNEAKDRLREKLSESRRKNR